ncbi:MAG: hypothetical protein ABF302_03025 [Polaribacter sp.]|jgi:hypothetical protein
MKSMFLMLATLFFLTGCEENESTNQVNELIDTWKLTSFVNESDNSIITETDFNDSNEITITFNIENNFTGTTIINTFLGVFSYDERDENLTISTISTTEVNENEWGNLFYESLNMGYNQQNTNWEFTYEIQNNILKIYYSNQEYMTFEKL